MMNPHLHLIETGMRTSTVLLSSWMLAFAAGCSCGGDSPSGLDGDDGTQDGGGNSGGGGSTDGGGGGGGGGGGNGGDVTVAPFPKGSACQVLTSEQSLGVKPVDILLLIDNSGSMTLEIQAVENNVNVNFAQILDQSGLDYRLILIAKHGSAAGDQSVCIRSPLSGTSCNPLPAQPANGARFFHYDIEISSTNSLRRLLDTYDTTDTHGFAPGGWKNWLRPDSVKTIVEITDDQSSLTADQFEAELFALEPAGTFGNATQRRYVFHSIIGIVANNPVTAAWGPSDPKQSQKCTSAAQAGTHYEDLSMRTGGLRFPVCETGSYDAVFQAAAQGVIASAELRCDFTPPAPPQGTPYQQSYVEYTPGTGSPVYFTEAADLAGCADNKYTRDAASNRITLCQAACDRVKADDQAKLAVVYACGNVIGIQ